VLFRSRLEHLYQSSYSFTFANVPGGFCVTVTIPFQTAPSASESPVQVGAA